MVFDLVKQKVITEEQARLSAQSNVITRALGIKPDLEVEILERPFEAGDRFLLCTDGIHGSIEEKRLIKQVTNRKIALGPVVDGIATEIDNIGRISGGGHDNLTLAIIETKLNSIKKDSMSKKIKQILLAIGAVCIISIAVNIFLTITTIGQSNTLKDLGDQEILMHTNDSLIGEIKKTELKRTEDSAKIEAIIQELEKDPKFKDSMNTLRIKLENKINK